MKRKITKKLTFENPAKCLIVAFWIDGEIVCIQCLTEKEKKENALMEDIIYRRNVEDPTLNACDRCAQPLHGDFSGNCHG